jgi:prevent-host-death family protein
LTNILTNTLTNLVKVRNLPAMTRQVNIYEAKTQLSRLVEEAAGGGVIIIAKDGKPRAKLVAIEDTAAKKEPRKLGQWAEQNKHIDWDKWDRDFKALDKVIEADFEASIAKPFPGMSESAAPAPAPAGAKRRPKRPAPRGRKRSRR